MLRRRGLLLLLVILATAPAAQASIPRDGTQATVEVIVELSAPPTTLERSPARAAASLRVLESAQRRLEGRILAVSPGAEVRWRYERVLDGLAVVLPESDAARLAALPGVEAVYPSVAYHALASTDPTSLDDVLTPSLIGAPEVWGASLDHAGRGIKIGIIDDGIDQNHPYFDPAGFTMPAGFPKGNVAFTTAKVIVARAFPPPGADWRYAGRPFDPVLSDHGTHVAGIAAGDHGTAGGPDRQKLSGIAPLAYLGNYKALTVPTPGVGLNGNSPEIVAAIEAAVADGMDVINLSLGEPEIDPSRDVVAKALDNAAAAGVIPVVAAGNEGDPGSVGSPATSQAAIAVAAVDDRDVLADFSSGGPSPIGLVPKPDVSAPGVDVLSSFPHNGFELLSGTSMASPQVAGAAALLRELHPDWSVADVKSSLVLTGKPVWKNDGRTVEAASSSQGGGLIDVASADAPLVLAAPQNLGFGYLNVKSGATAAQQTVSLADAGGGSGVWDVVIQSQTASDGVEVSVPSTVTVPGSLVISVSAAADAVAEDHTGFVVLTRGGQTRRLPYWFRVTAPLLPTEPFQRVGRTGTYPGDTGGRPSRVDAYRYPAPAGAPPLAGPEEVFRFTLDRPVANVGAAIVSQGKGVHVVPLLVAQADENRLTGATGFPFVTNPYLDSYREPQPIVGALLPSPGAYAVVFDSRHARDAGRFRFRFWIDDTTPPSVHLLSRTVRNRELRARVSDAGSGVDPKAITFTIDGSSVPAGRLVGDIAVLDVTGFRPGLHRLVLSVSDRQEAKNDENVPRILPNTRVVKATIRVPKG